MVNVISLFQMSKQRKSNNISAKESHTSLECSFTRFSWEHVQNDELRRVYVSNYYIQAYCMLEHIDLPFKMLIMLIPC